MRLGLEGRACLGQSAKRLQEPYLVGSGESEIETLCSSRFLGRDAQKVTMTGMTVQKWAFVPLPRTVTHSLSPFSCKRGRERERQRRGGD